jgi:hypothetical protein
VLGQWQDDRGTGSAARGGVDVQLTTEQLTSLADAPEAIAGVAGLIGGFGERLRVEAGPLVLDSEADVVVGAL